MISQENTHMILLGVNIVTIVASMEVLQFGSDVVTGLVFVEAEFRDLVKIGSHGYYIKIFSVHLIFLVEVILEDL